MAISIAKARSLCTKAELDFVMSSSPKNIATLSAARLKQKVILARKLRDKWLAQSQRQRREKQAALQARDTSANARSEEKAELFAEVLERFNKQLQKTEGRVGGASNRQSPPRKVRATEHREKRAVTRKSLQEKTEAIALEQSARQASDKKSNDEQPTPRKPAKKKAAASRVAKKKPVEKKPVKTTVGKKKAAKASKAFVARKKKASARATADAAPADAPKPAAVKKTNLQARTAAKQSRVVQSGAVRVQKHISARGRRSQGRRDSRG